MPMNQRLDYNSFAENQEFIESRWDKNWGDRINELVFIGQDINKDQMVQDLQDCLINDKELLSQQQNFQDPFPEHI
jgi:G3E family GTPase